MTPEWVQVYGRRSTAQQKDERRQDIDTKNDLCDSTRAITVYFVRWPVNGIGGEQRGVVSTALWASLFPMLRVRHIMRMRIPSSVKWKLLNYLHVKHCYWLVSNLLDIPNVGYPSCRHTTRASLILQPSSQIVPHTPRHISTLPSLVLVLLPTKRISPSTEQDRAVMISEQ